MTVMMTVFFVSGVLPHFGAPGVGLDRVVFSALLLVLTGVILALHPRRAIAALTLPLLALVAALRTDGFRLVAWTAGTGTVIFGAASALLPEQASSPGAAWGTAVALGRALFDSVAEVEARRASQNTRGRSPTSGAA